MISKKVQFWTYLIPYIPSIVCTIFVIYHLLLHHASRVNLNNHVPLLLLLTGLLSQITVYPWMFHWLSYDGVWERTPSFCSVWAFFDWGIYCTQTMLFAWGSFERHVLIFHDRLLKKKFHRFVLHYLPLVIILVYCFIYYSIMYLFPPQPNTFDYTEMFCVREFLLRQTHFAVYDMLVHQISPVCIIILCSLLLLGRVIWWKVRLHQQNQWRRRRKMTIQLLSIAALYSTFALPYSFYYTLVLAGVSNDVLDLWYSNTNYLTYFPILFLPFFCLTLSNESRRKLKHWIRILRCRNGLITPATQVRTSQH